MNWNCSWYYRFISKVLLTIIKKLEELKKVYAMKINVVKTKLMGINNIRKWKSWQVKTKFLESILTEDWKFEEEINARIAIAKEVFSKKRIFYSNVDLEMRTRLVKWHVWSLFLYELKNRLWEKEIGQDWDFWNEGIEKNRGNKMVHKVNNEKVLIRVKKTRIQC